MSKKDRRNRDPRNNFQEDFDQANQNFDEIEDSFASSLDEISDEFEQATASLREKLDGKTAARSAPKESLVDDFIEDEESDRPGLLFRLTSVFSAISFGKIGSALLALPVLLYGGLRWSGGKVLSLGKPLGGIFRKLGSFMVLKDMDEEAELEEESKSLSENHAEKPLPKTLAKENVKNAPLAAKMKAAKDKQAGAEETTVPNSAFIEDEDFEEERSPWIGYAVKAAALVCMLLLAVGGYYGIKTTLYKNKESNVEGKVEIAQSPAESDDKAKAAKAVPALVENAKNKIASKADTNVLAKNQASSKPKDAPPAGQKPNEKGPNPNVPNASKDSKAAIALKDKDIKPGNTKDDKPALSGKDKKPESKTPSDLAQSSPKKTQDKQGGEGKKKPEPPKAVVPPKPEAAFALAAPEAKTDQAAPKTGSSPFDLAFTQPEALPTQKPEPKTGGDADPQRPMDAFAAGSATATSDPFSFAASPTPPPAQASTAFNETPKNKPEDQQTSLNSPPAPPTDLWALPVPAASNAAAIVPEVSTNSSSASAFHTPNSANIPVKEPQTNLPALTSATDTMPLESARSVQGLSSSTPESGGLIPALAPIAPLQPLSAPASSAPLTTNSMNQSVSADPSSAAFQPLVPSNDSVPGIPQSGGSPFSVSSNVPQAPKVDYRGPLMSRSDSIPPLEPQIQKPETIPAIPMGDAPIPVKPTTSFAAVDHSEGLPAIPNDTSPNAIKPLSDFASTNASEQRIAIPGHYAAAEIPTNSTATSTVFGTPQTPGQPQTQQQLQQLVQASPHLGTGLQNQMQEYRSQQNQSATEPQLRFGNASTNTSPNQGAVRFSAAAAAQNLNSIPNGSNTLLPMPTSPNDSVDNVLFGLNPTGQKADNVDEIARSLPAESSSPQPMFADVGRGYQRSIPHNGPAQAQIDSSTTDGQAKRENRALLFRQHVEQSVTKSPQTAEKYSVKPGDTYMTISNEKFGTHLLYRALAEHNRLLGAAYMPTEGTVIEIPTAEYLQTNYAEALSRGARPRGNRNASGNGGFQRTSQSVNRATAVRYTVQEGDSIMSIATNQLRDSHRWREIVELNADQIQDVRDIRVGMQILLPGAPAANTASSSSNVFGRR